MGMVGAVVEGLWGLADEAEQRGEFGAAAKCLEAVLQCGASLLPLAEARTRLRLATLLLERSHNLGHARVHLERAHLLLAPLPSALPLRLRSHSLLARCYHLSGAIAPQRHVLLRALHVLASSADAASLDPFSARLWSCNLHAQLASALAVEADYPSALAALEAGLHAAPLDRPDLRLFFAASALHLHLLHWDDTSSVASAALLCSQLWDALPPNFKEHCIGLFFYQELLHTFYLLRLCDYKGAAQHVSKLEAAMTAEQQKAHHVRQLASELDALNQSLLHSNLQRKERIVLSEKQGQLRGQLRVANGSDWGGGRGGFGDKLQLAPPPIDGEWLPRSAVFALVDLVVVMLGRPKGVFKECGRRIQSGLQLIHGG